jgi:CheY-like chemotaxis protein
MYQVEAAENAAEAIELIEELDAEQIETLLIVSDWLMPEMKGDEFLIRVHQKFPKIAKVMLTGQADADAIENAKKNANLHHCLTKPWTEEELIRIINSAIA